MKRVTRAAVIAALILAVGTGVAWATGAVSGFVGADGTITACIQKDSFNTRIVPDGTACRSTEQLVTFNQKGLKGDQGIQGIPGPQGAQGPKGDKGDPGVDGTDGTDGKDGKDGSDLVGSPCSLPNGTPGTVEMTVTANGAISWTCHTAAPPALCPSPLPTYANAVTGCDPATGTVSITCNAGFQNRDGNIANGCEFAAAAEVCNGLDDDGDGLVDNGAPVPSIPNGTGGCVNGAFNIVSCNAGFADVDGQFGNGCEVNLLVDANNCGSVGNRVPASGVFHANWACTNGAVVMTGCVAGFFNANGTAVDGCEFQADSFEPNDTLATPRNLGFLSPGASSTIFANLTPLNDDWFQVGTNGCSVFSLCHMVVQPSANVAGMVLITRDDGLAVAPNATDTTTAGHTYLIHVVAPAAYVSSYTISVQNA